MVSGESGGPLGLPDRLGDLVPEGGLEPPTPRL